MYILLFLVLVLVLAMFGAPGRGLITAVFCSPQQQRGTIVTDNIVTGELPNVWPGHHHNCGVV